MTKVYVYISNVESYLENGDLDYALYASNKGPDELSEYHQNYPCIAEFDVDVEEQVDRAELTKLAMKSIDKAEKDDRAQHEREMQRYADRRSRILAIPSSVQR